MLRWWGLCPLNLIPSEISLRRLGPLGFLWISTLASLPFSLIFLFKILANRSSPSRSTSPGLRCSWQAVFVPMLAALVLVALFLAGVVDFYPWKSKRKINWRAKSTHPTEKLLCEEERWQKSTIADQVGDLTKISHDLLQSSGADPTKWAPSATELRSYRRILQITEQEDYEMLDAINRVDDEVGEQSRETTSRGDTLGSSTFVGSNQNENLGGLGTNAFINLFDEEGDHEIGSTNDFGSVDRDDGNYGYED